jgi:iron(III) transport system substrate-binding protein
MSPRRRLPLPSSRLRLALSLTGLSLAAALTSCSPEPDLIVYCELDQIFSEELIQRFEQESGLEVRAEYGIEAARTVGLVQRLIEEDASQNTRCDVFWNNEVAHTVRLAERGMLMPYDSPSAAEIPPLFKDTDQRWTGFAARARVLIVNTDLADPSEIHGMWDLLDPKWKGQVAIARPLTGTTLTHATALADVIGKDKAQEYFEAIAAAGETGAVNIVTSNGEVMRKVSEGVLSWGWTDTDDYNVALQNGKPVAVVYPDQDTIGTLLIPNTVCIMKKAPRPDAAKQFIDWVLSEEIEQALAESRSAQIPLRPGVPRPEHVRAPDSFTTMSVSYQSIGKRLEASANRFREMFVR